jgi:hypothetical protein
LNGLKHTIKRNLSQANVIHDDYSAVLHATASGQFSEMYNFLLATPDERRAELELQRRALANIPRTSPSAAVLADRASTLLEVKILIEEILLLLQAMFVELLCGFGSCNISCKDQPRL